MVLNKSNILIGGIVLLCISFTLFQFQELDYISNISKALIVPLITVLYFINAKYKSTYFTWFFILFSFSELLVFSEYFLKTKNELHFYYVIGNSLYILAYIFLLNEVIKGLNFKKVFKNYKLQLFVLSILNIYIVYVLYTIVQPLLALSSMVFIEFVYNTVMLLLLTFALIAYFYNDNKKSLLFFLGTLCLVFSEFIQVAYFYITDKNLFIFASTLLFVMAFCFFYFHAKTRSVNI
ncbi:MAG: hypothetical protein ABI295_01840 [Xanthomarina sp.]